MIPFRDDIPADRTPLVTYALIVVNVVVLWSMSRLSDERLEEVVYRHGFVPARIGQLFTNRAIEVVIKEQVEDPRRGVRVVERRIELPPDPTEIILSAFTSMFMHGGLMHLVGNLWFLWLFGDNVEDRLGHVKYLIFYLLGGLSAVACHWLNGPGSATPVVGASGAIAAVLGAYIVTWPHARIRTLVVLVIFITVIELPAIVFLGGWFLLQLISATQPKEFGMEQSIAWWAHVGGFVAGAILMIFLRGPTPRVRRDDFFDPPDGHRRHFEY